MNFKACLSLCTKYYFSIISLFFYLQLAIAENNILDFSQNNTKFKISEEQLDQKQSLELNLQADNLSVLNVFDVNDPNRIVIDLKEAPFNKIKSLALTNSKVIEKLRTGRHPDKYRLVLDLRTEKIPQYSWSQKANTLIISINNENVKAESKNISLELSSDILIDYKFKIPEQQSILPELEALQPVHKANQNNEIHASLKTEILASENKHVQPEQEQSNQQQLKALYFSYDKDNKTPLLKLVMENRPKFTLTKENTNLYELNIPDCTLEDPYLELIQFPPQDFKGLNLVKPKSNTNNLIITLGVDRTTRLTALAKDNEIWIKTSE